MRRRVVGGWIVVALALPACVATPDWQGPLPVRNQHPAQLTVMHMPPAATAMLPAGAVQARLDAAYSSLFLSGQDGNRSWHMDGEYLRAATSLRLGLGGGCELAAEVPIAHTSGGFLDAFLIDYHETFGLPDQGRDTAPKNEFEIAARQSGQTVWSVDADGAELLDVPLYATVQLLAPALDRLGLAVRGGVEFPTGDDERGYGSGEIEPGCGALLEYRTGSVAFYGHAQYTWAGTPAPAQRAGLPFADVVSLGAGAELPLTAELHALVQVEWENSTLRHFGLRTTDRDQILLWVGGRWFPIRQLGFEVGLGEDLQGLASPDFTAWFGMVWNPGAGRPADLPR